MDSKELKDYISKKRDSLSNSSVNTYSSILRSLYKQIHGTTAVDPKKFDDSKEVIAAIKDLPPNKRKTILSALTVVSGKREYRDLMMEDISNYRKEINEQEKTPKQKASWVTQEEIGQTYKQLEKQAQALYKKGSLTNAEKQKFQDYVILALLSGIHIPVRRSKDYVDFKLRNVDEDKDNYIDKSGKKLVFNSYKTSKAYGKQTLPLPTKLRNVLKRWASINDSDYLLIDSNNNPLGNNDSSHGSVKLNQRLERIFNGKKVGVNGLRHSILSEKYKPMIEQKRKIEEDLKKMGSSGDMATTYIKN